MSKKIQSNLDVFEQQNNGRMELLKLMSGEWLARAVYVAAKLDIAELLEEESQTIEELAHQISACQESLHRLISLLLNAGLFKIDDTGRISNNAVSALLSSRNPYTLKHLIIYYGEIAHLAWEKLLPSIKSGKVAFEMATDLSQFKYGKAYPAKGDLFHNAMKEKSKAVIDSVIKTYDFSRFNSVCDLGGGYGHFMLALLDAHPHMKGIVFELPEVVEAIKASNRGFPSARCELIAGNFFENVPSGVDAFLMKSVPHDWDDGSCITIFKNCHKVLNKGGRLILVEIVLQPGAQHIFSYCMDLLMLAVAEGKERPLEAWITLFEQSGFVLEAVYPTATEFSVIVASKK